MEALAPGLLLPESFVHEHRFVDHIRRGPGVPSDPASSAGLFRVADVVYVVLQMRRPVRAFPFLKAEQLRDCHPSVPPK